MYLKDELTKLSADIKVAARSWAESKIDELATNRPRLKAASVYLKRGVNNWLNQQEAEIDRMVDNLALFIADADGRIDTDMLFGDAIKLFKEMDVCYTNVGDFAIEYGNGAVVVNMPHNALVDFIFGDLGQIKITADDIMEMKSMLK